MISTCKLCQACFLTLSYPQHYSDKIQWKGDNSRGSPVHQPDERPKAAGPAELPFPARGDHTPQLAHLPVPCAHLSWHSLSRAKHFHLAPLRDHSTGQSENTAALQSSTVLHLRPHQGCSSGWLREAGTWGSWSAATGETVICPYPGALQIWVLLTWPTKHEWFQFWVISSTCLVHHFSGPEHYA